MQKDQKSLGAWVLTLWPQVLQLWDAVVHLWSTCETQRRMIAMRCDPSNGHNSAPSTTEPVPATQGQKRHEDCGQGIECCRQGACNGIDLGLIHLSPMELIWVDSFSPLLDYWITWIIINVNKTNNKLAEFYVKKVVKHGKTSPSCPQVWIVTMVVYCWAHQI